MRILIFTICFVVAYSSASAQSDSVKTLILNRPSISTQISNGRQILLEELLAGNEQSARDVRNTLMAEVEITPYVALSDAEYLMSLYWTRDYDELLEYTAAEASDSLFFYSPDGDSRIFPSYDELAISLPFITADSLTVLDARLDEAMPEPVKREYLKLLLRWIVTENTDYTTLKEISDLSIRYLEDYPGSPHRTFISNHLIIIIEANDWGWGSSIGMGTAFMGGSTSQYFKNPGFAMSMTYEVLYRNIYAGLGVNFLTTGLGKDITFGDSEFRRGNRIGVAGGDIRLGYKILDTPHFALVPYAVVGGSGLTVNKKGDVDNSATKSALTYGGGVFLDIKFPSRESAEYIFTGRESSYTSLRLRYHVTTANYSLHGTDKTVVHWLTLELGMFTRRHHLVRP